MYLSVVLNPPAVRPFYPLLAGFANSIKQMTHPPFQNRLLPRREFLWRFGGGLGGIALTHLLAEQGLLADTGRLKPGLQTGRAIGAPSDLNGGLHHRAKAKRVIQLFMNGGASQMDTFDYKPQLIKYHGRKFDPGGGVRVEAVTSAPGMVMKSPLAFKQHGQCGRWVSSAFPHLA